MVREELEALTGKLIRGDITAVVYELIKDSPFIDDIYEYSGVEKEEVEDVYKGSGAGPTDDFSSFGADFQNWLTDQVQSIPVSGNVQNNKGTGTSRGNRDKSNSKALR